MPSCTALRCVAASALLAAALPSAAPHAYLTDARRHEPRSACCPRLQAHACVQQTAIDLLLAGKGVHVVVDACSSQRQLDRDVALQQLAHAGATLTTTESLLLTLMRSAEHKHFKEISKLLKEQQDAYQRINML